MALGMNVIIFGDQLDNVDLWIRSLYRISHNHCLLSCLLKSSFDVFTQAVIDLPTIRTTELLCRNFVDLTERIPARSSCREILSLVLTCLTQLRWTLL